jgi:peptidoglycan hydrolase-like protein with peptidoglycan-binding domain
VRDRARGARIANLERGASPTGGPGTREITRAVQTAAKVRSGKANLKTLQRQLRAAGYAIKVDGVWGDQTEAAYRAFTQGIADVSTERRAEQRRVIQRGVEQPDRPYEQAALGGMAFTYDQQRNAMRADLLRQAQGQQAVKQFVAGQKEPRPWWKKYSVQEGILKGVPAAIGAADDLVDAAFARAPGDQGEAAQQYLQSAGQRQMEWAAQVGLDFRQYLQENEGPNYAGMPTPKFVTNLIGGLTSAALGLPGGLIYGVTDPKGLAKAVGESYAWQYGPLAEGDFDTFFDRLEEEPAGPLLDAISLASLGTAAWARTLGTRVAKTPRSFKYTNLDGRVERVPQRRARSEMMSRFQNVYDRLSEARPDAPLYGAFSRAARSVEQGVEHAKGEAMIQSSPFRHALAKAGLRGRTGTQALLFDRMFVFGERWVEGVRANIAMDEKRLARPDIGIKEKKRLARRISQLEQVLKYEGKVPEKVQRMLDEGLELSNLSEAIKIRAGALSQETADYRRNLAMRIVYDPENIDNPAREDLDWLLSHHFKEGEAAVHLQLADNLAHSLATSTGMSPSEAFGRLFQSIDRNVDPQALPGQGPQVILPPGVRRPGAPDQDVLYHGPLEGLPPKGSPNPEVRAVAAQFSHGPAPRTYRPADPARAARIAEWYDKAEHAPDDPAVRASYDAFARETREQYDALTQAGYTFEFYPDADPYPTGPWAAMDDLRENKHLYVYPTEEGFGTEAVTTQHPLLADSGVRWNGKVVTHNDLFRAVHDVMGHHKEGVGFRADGEENAWRQHVSMYSEEARPAMTAETRGQNSWVNFGPHGEKNRTAGQGETVYADQKATLAPEWVVREGADDDVLNQEALFDAGDPVKKERAVTSVTRESLEARHGTDLAPEIDADGIAAEVISSGMKLPPELQDAAALAARIREVYGMARAGTDGRYWYDTAAQIAKDVSASFRKGKHLKEVTPKQVAQLIAIFSQAADTLANMSFVREAIYQYRDHGTTYAGRFPERQHREADAVMRGESWEGRKRSSFYANIIESLDPEEYRALGFDKHPVTVDRWVTRWFIPDQDVPGEYYDAFESIIQKMSERMGWEPKEVQAAAWVTSKKLSLAERHPKWTVEQVDAAGRDAYDVGFNRYFGQEAMLDASIISPHAKRAANALRKPDGGASLRKDLTPDRAKTGYMVALGPHEQVLPTPAKAEMIQSFRDLHKGLLDADSALRVGVWHGVQDGRSDGRIYFDLSKRVTTLKEALELGRAQGQLAVFDLRKGKSIPTGLSEDAANTIKNRLKDDYYGKNTPPPISKRATLTPTKYDEFMERVIKEVYGSKPTLAKIRDSERWLENHPEDPLHEEWARLHEEQFPFDPDPEAGFPPELRERETVLAQEADDDWVIPEDVDAWVAAGRDEFEGIADEPDIPFEEPGDFKPIVPNPVNQRPAKPQMPEIRQIPGESDEAYAARVERARADFLIREMEYDFTDPDKTGTDLTFPGEWEEDMLAQDAPPSRADYTIREMPSAGVGRVQVQKGGRGGMIFDSREAAEAFITEQVKRRQYLLEKHPEFYYQHARREGTAARAAIAFDQSDAGRMFLGPLADMSSPPHEIIHQLRRVARDIVGEQTWTRLEGEISKLTETPIRGGVWHKEHEEVFARMGERWLREGVAPSHHSWDAFRTLSQALGEVYPNVPPSFPKVTPAARTVFERGFNPASGVEAPGAGYRPEITPAQAGRSPGRPRSTQIKKAAAEFGTDKRNTGRMFVEARGVPGPMVVLRDFERTVKAQTKTLAIESLRKFTTPWDYERQAIPDGYAPIVFKPGQTGEIPRVFREEADYADRMPGEYGRMLLEEEHAALARHFPTPDEIRAEGVPEGAEVHLIPIKIKEAYVGKSLRMGQQGGPAIEALKTMLDYGNAITKTALVYGKLSYIPVNFAGNLIFLTTHAGPFAAPALVRASRFLGGLDVDDLAKMDFWVGEGQYARLATERGGQFLEGIHHLATFQSKIADRLPRRAAFIYSAGKRGYTSKEELRSLLNDPEKRADLEAAAAEAKEAMVNFDGMTAFEKEYMTRLIFVYGWIRGATRYGAHLSTEMPLRADFLYHVGQEGSEMVEERIGKLDDYLRGIVPFGEKFKKLGVDAIEVRNLRSINPISTAGETLELLLNSAPGSSADDQGAQAMDYLTPMLKMPLEYASGYNFFFGKKYDQRSEALEQPLRWPLVKLGKELIDPTVSVEDISGVPDANRKNYIPATSPWDARKQALEENVLGGLADKTLDLGAVQARAKDNEPPDPKADFLEDMKLSGQTPSASALSQLDAFIELSEDPRMKRGSPSKDKAIAMAELYAKQHPGTAVVARAKALKSDAAAERLQRKLGDALFGAMRAYENRATKILEANLEE